MAAHDFAAQAASANIHVTMVYVPTGNTPESEIIAIMKDVGQTSGGLFKQAKPDASDLSDVIVDTHLPAYDLRGFLSHQLRWARGVRDSRAGGYIGLISTYGLFWALATLLSASAAPWSWAVAGVTVLLRLAMAVVVGKSVLRDASLVKNLWLLPVRDLVAVAVWVASFAGHTVTWRGDRFKLKNGRLFRIS